MNDLSRDLLSFRPELRAIVERVADSGWLVQGPEHDLFEQELAQYLDVAHVLGVGSGTDALELALRSVMPAGRKVVVTAANCGGYTTTAARRAGLTVRFVDVDPHTLLVDPAALAGVLDDTVGAVVVTHLYGRAAEIGPLRTICAPLGIKIVEDCAQAIGARTHEGAVGSLADVAAFSFYPTKNLGALGDGGAIATNSDELSQSVRELRQYGWRHKYSIERTGGCNSRLDELQAAVLRARLPKLRAWNERRREIVSAYVASATPHAKVLPALDAGHVAHLAVLLCEERTQLQQHLAKRRIRSDVHYPIPDHQQLAFRDGYPDAHLPVTERLARMTLSLPVFPELRADEVERVCDALAAF